MTHAFPHNTVVVDKDGGIKEHHRGMELRDYFAAKAMQGLLAGTSTSDGDAIVKDSYALADAMLKEREA